ncbi:hypothetical protein ACEQ8H_005367 [Pleosporales sp. CAS-2024a]
MKTFAIASVMALASVASAQLTNIPSCALACLLTPLGSDGCSSINDFKCHCQKGSSLLSTVQPCVQGACSASDQAKTITAVQKTCEDAGVPISIPNASGAASAVSSAAASITSAAASVVSSEAAKASSAGAAISSILSSVASAASSAAASKVSSALDNATRSGSSATPTSSVVQATGGAPMATQAVGLFGAAALAMLAL